ncbi:uncharacterized protein [Narcine bancroftii]|uniref:uncharacterized protein n=1 Tax=Narcine bancroftii TaxID=1343680 RepID=UPI003831F302
MVFFLMNRKEAGAEIANALADIYNNILSHRKYGHHQALLLQEDGHHCHRCYFRLIHPCFPPHRFDWPQYYRAPELIFRAPDDISNIVPTLNFTVSHVPRHPVTLTPGLPSLAYIYSAGCVLAELLLGQLIFPRDSGVEQLVEMIKISIQLAVCWLSCYWDSSSSPGTVGWSSWCRRPRSDLGSEETVSQCLVSGERRRSQETELEDIYSAGCVLAELLLGQLSFPRDSGVEQLVMMIKVRLGVGGDSESVPGVR